MDILYLLTGLVLGAVVIYFIMRARTAAIQERLSMTEDMMEGLKQQHQQQITEQQAQFDKRSTEQQQLQKEQMQAQKEQWEQQMKLLQEQVNSTSERILKDRAQELSNANHAQLSVILTPLQEHIRQMKEETEKMRKDHSNSLERLDASIRSNMEREKAMGEQTERLAQALTGENKVQGNFGELKLKQILQDMGLEEGLQFEEQTTMRDEAGNTITEETGHRMIPDVILHFPDQRDVIIDSKMSFTAFVEYQNAPDETTRSAALQKHLTSIRNHVRELAQKQYHKYTKSSHAKLDFVLMYVFQESALQLALLNDNTLWKWAYDQGVILSGGQNLYMTLRVLEMIWKQVKQVENQENIMKCANTLVERVQLFAERFAKADDLLQKTRKSFDELNTVTATSGQSITTAARNLLKYGAQENKKKKSIAPPTSEALPETLPEENENS